MQVKEEILLSILSVCLGVTGTYLAIQQYSINSRERLLAERKALILAEESIRVLRRDFDEISRQMQQMLEKVDQRCDTLERQCGEIQAVMKALLTQKSDK